MWLSNLGQGLHDVCEQVFWNAPLEMFSTLHKKGTVKISNLLFVNIDRVCKVAANVFEALDMKDSPAAKDNKIFIDAYFGVVGIKFFADNFINKKTWRFKMPEKNVGSTVFLAIGNACQIPYYFSRQLKLFNTPTIDRVAGILQQYKPFQIRPFSLLLDKPKDFFVALGSAYKLKEIYQANKTKSIKETLNAKTVLDVISNVGKVVLPLRLCGSWTFTIAVATNISGLVGALIRPEEPSIAF